MLDDTWNAVRGDRIISSNMRLRLLTDDRDENACILILVVSVNESVWKICAVVVATPRIRTNGNSWQ